MALPIPDRASPIRYRDIAHADVRISSLVDSLPKCTVRAADGAHLDPDLRAADYPRHPDWRPLFGQSGAAQGHLRNQGVDSGDVFVFFGLFQPVVQTGTGWQYRKDKPATHRTWGWLQIDKQVSVPKNPKELPRWMHYHPHCHHPEYRCNTLYTGTNKLKVSGLRTTLPGAGVFPYAHDDLRLTASGSSLKSHWKLPLWMYPKNGRKPLTYHAKMQRWQRHQTHTTLVSAARGQEFVLDTRHYPEAMPWIVDLITQHHTT